ncbi:MAG: C13 family peptidase [Methylococcales bacterium]
MIESLTELKSNLAAGLKLVCLRECRLADFCVSLDQLVLLGFLDLTLEILSDYPALLPDPVFNGYAFPLYGFGFGCLLFACYLISRIIGKPDALLELVVILFSAMPVFYLFNLLIAWLTNNPAGHQKGLISVLAMAYYFVLAVTLMRRVRIVALPRKRFAVLGLTIFVLVWVMPGSYFGGWQKFWIQDYVETEDESDDFADYRNFDAEALMFNQYQVLQKSLEALKPGSPEITDLYFISFASYAYQDVFLKEANYTRQLFDQRFGTRGRSLRLINHLQTRDEIPLATATNLAASLKHIGKIMNLDEDILVLYLTTHGSKDHQLAVSFWPLALNDIDPGMLRKMLDDAAIQWRVIIISACYSGGFVQALEDSRTLVATAAAADKTSFGCSNENDFTYFGEAIFKEQLNRRFSFLDAFEQGALSLEKRERTEDLKPSEPQLSVGDSIRIKLELLTGELTSRYCHASDPESEAKLAVCG